MQNSLPGTSVLDRFTGCRAHALIPSKALIVNRHALIQLKGFAEYNRTLISCIFQLQHAFHDLPPLES